MSAICGTINLSDKGLLKEMITAMNYRGIYIHPLERVRSMITVALRCGNEKNTQFSYYIIFKLAKDAFSLKKFHRYTLYKEFNQKTCK